MKRITLILSILFFSFSSSHAQVQLWGMTYKAGDSGAGVLFNYNVSSSTDSVIHDFCYPGNTPSYSALLQATDGNLYGMTSGGGIFYKGTLFKYNILSGTLTTIVNFSGLNGYWPVGKLIQGKDGNLYGMTSAGGGSYGTGNHGVGYGTLFKCTTSGVLTTIVSFDSIHGYSPSNSLIQGFDSNLYGMTAYGGLHDSGTIFKCTTSGIITTLANLDTKTGNTSTGYLLQASDSNLYGMTTDGGSYGYGTLFKCSTAGTYTALFNFNGATPTGSLIQAFDSNLYGMSEGGSGGIFKCTTSGVFTLLNSLREPIGTLVQASDSNLYGYGSGSIYSSSIFKCTTSGALTTIYTFPNAVNNNVDGSLIQANDGNFYGMTYNGGHAYSGTIFRITPSGTYIDLHDFGGSAIGYYPVGNLIQATDGDLYGATSYGGKFGTGSILKCNPSTGAISTLASFNDTNGIQPTASLIQGIDGNFYGMAVNGGINFAKYGGEVGEGTLFKCSPSGVITLLVSFNDTNGGYPYGSLLQASDSNLYGMTSQGGSAGEGTIFKCTTSGILTTLVSFNGTNGNTPNGSLIQASDGNLYGTTMNTIFKCTQAGTLAVLVNLSDTNEYPSGSLVQATDGNLYGMTTFGGSSYGTGNGGFGYGTLFKCTTSGVFTTLVNFDSIHGCQPGSNLIQASDGNFYGMTEIGGKFGLGTVFQYTPSGTLTTLVDLDGTNGSDPVGGLLEIQTSPLATKQIISAPSELMCYPNPATNMLNLSWDMQGDSKTTISVMDVSGKIIIPSLTTDHLPITINTSSLSAGMYFVKAVNGKATQTVKFVKQ